jgi:dipeptidyl aminopeptidase/acylaminoacyl peptidase
VTLDDLFDLIVPGEPALHPGGRLVAYTRTRMDPADDLYRRQIWLAGEGEVRRFTAGPGDSKPRWSPDGDRLAFLRERDGVKQLAVMPREGGEPEVITDFELGVEDLVWMPDGRRLLVVAVTWTEEWAGMDPEERTRRPRRIRHFPYRFDNRGRLDDRRRHIWLVEPGADPRCLTPGDYDETAPAVAPDGNRFCFLSNRDPARGLVAGTQVWEQDIDGTEPRQVCPRGRWTLPSYRPDGVLHLVGNPQPTFPSIESLHRVEDDGTLTDLTGHLDRSVVTLAVPPTVCWDGDDAYVGLEDAGTFRVVKVGPDGLVDEIVTGRRVVTGFDVAAGVVAFTASEVTDPGTLHLFDGAEETILDRPNHLDLAEAEHFTVISDGWEIDAWVYLPPGSEPVPTLLNIHGGPASQYGFGFFDEFQVYVGAGFGVIACNPRGSAGKGREFLTAVVGDGWGRVDLADVLAVVEAAVERFPRIDPERLGVMGGSYGGFLTAWVTAHDTRFRSAVVERALLSFPSFWGTSDIGPTFTPNYTEADYPDGWPVWFEHSPIAHAHRVRTPTLILHSENDFRSPIEQAEQYFVALLRNGTPVEFLRFPEEGHEMSRSGKPRHRRERFEAIIDWHRRHLTADRDPAVG